MSDFFKFHYSNAEGYLNAYAVSAIYPNANGITVVEMKLADQSFFTDETPEEILNMVDAIVNGPPAGPVVVPNFPGMEQK